MTAIALCTLRARKIHPKGRVLQRLIREKVTIYPECLVAPEVNVRLSSTPDPQTQ